MSDTNEGDHTKPDDPPADPPKHVDQPPQLSPGQMETLAAQVTQNIMKQLAERGSTTIDQQAGSSSSGPADRGERWLGLPQLSCVPANIKITRRN